MWLPGRILNTVYLGPVEPPSIRAVTAKNWSIMLSPADSEADGHTYEGHTMKNGLIGLLLIVLGAAAY